MLSKKSGYDHKSLMTNDDSLTPPSGVPFIQLRNIPGTEEERRTGVIHHFLLCQQVRETQALKPQHLYASMA